jgi:hypothetical protein
MRVEWIGLKKRRKTMTTVTILPANPGAPEPLYQAVGGGARSLGRTPGAALDALTAQLAETEAGTLIVVQQLRPDPFFTAEQQRRLEDLMSRWRAARNQGVLLAPEEKAELERLVTEEVQASTRRAAALLSERHARV